MRPPLTLPASPSSEEAGRHCVSTFPKPSLPTECPQRKKAATASAMLHQAFGEHGVDRAVKGFETLVNVCFSMDAGEDAAAARH
jgi:hypothetical protein